MKNMILRFVAVLFVVLFSAFTTGKPVSDELSVLQTDYELIHYFVPGEDFSYVGFWPGAGVAIPFYYYSESSKADLGTPILEEIGISGIQFAWGDSQVRFNRTEMEGSLFCHEFVLIVTVLGNYNDYELIGDFEVRFSNVRDRSFRIRLIQDKLNG